MKCVTHTRTHQPGRRNLPARTVLPLPGYTIKINRKFSNAQFWWSLIIFASVSSAGLLSLSLSLPVLSPVPSAVDVITIINLARDYTYICFFSPPSLFFSLMILLPCEDHFISGLLWVFAAVCFPTSRRLRQRRRQIKCLCRLPLIKTYHKFRYEKLFCTISNHSCSPDDSPELTTTCSMSCCVRVFVCSSGCVGCPVCSDTLLKWREYERGIRCENYIVGNSELWLARLVKVCTLSFVSSWESLKPNII